MPPRKSDGSRCLPAPCLYDSGLHSPVTRLLGHSDGSRRRMAALRKKSDGLHCLLAPYLCDSVSHSLVTNLLADLCYRTGA